MVLISSIFKNHFALALLILLAGCAEKKIRPLSVPNLAKAESTNYGMGPELSVRDDRAVFIDKAADYGLAGVQGVHLYAVDANNDKSTDLVVLDDFYASPRFYYFDKKTKKFKLGHNPFNEIVRASYLNFIDFDRDGVLDVLIGNLNQKSEMTQLPPRIFKGVLENGNVRYEHKVTLPVEVLPTASIVPLDFNLDGEIDLFLANWFSQNHENPRPLNDILLKGQGFTFENMSGLLKGENDFNKGQNFYPNATPTFGASVCDVDKNGFPDIMTNNSNGYFNKLWLNTLGESFTNFATESGYGGDGEGSLESRGGGNSFFSLCGDYNNDGIVDIALGNLSKDSDSEERDRSAILTGARKSFPPLFIRSELYDIAAKSKWSQGNRRGNWIDYNLDGNADLLISNSGFPPDSRLIFFEQQKDHEYIDKARELGINLVNPSGVVTIDLNGDGVMDFIAGQSKVRAGESDTRLYVYENQTKRYKKGSIRFHLQGKKSNYHGISSSFSFVTNKKARFSEANYVYGSLPSQNEEGAYFAFAEESSLYVEVRWSLSNLNRLGKPFPLVKKYDLTKFNGKGRHLELNLCEDGRILPRKKDCY